MKSPETDEKTIQPRQGRRTEPAALSGLEDLSALSPVVPPSLHHRLQRPLRGEIAFQTCVDINGARPWHRVSDFYHTYPEGYLTASFASRNKYAMMAAQSNMNPNHTNKLATGSNRS